MSRPSISELGISHPDQQASSSIVKKIAHQAAGPILATLLLTAAARYIRPDVPVPAAQPPETPTEPAPSNEKRGFRPPLPSEGRLPAAGEIFVGTQRTNQGEMTPLPGEAVTGQGGFGGVKGGSEGSNTGLGKKTKSGG